VRIYKICAAQEWATALRDGKFVGSEVDLRDRWCRRGQGAKAADLKCPSPRPCECFTLGAHGFPFCPIMLTEDCVRRRGPT